MTPPDFDSQKVLRLEEQLRQERTVFDQTLAHTERWFTLRLRLGYLAAVLLPSFFLLASYFIIEHEAYPVAVVNAASAALFVDVIGLVLAVWKLVMNPDSMPKATPLIDIADSQRAKDSRET